MTKNQLKKLYVHTMETKNQLKKFYVHTMEIMFVKIATTGITLLVTIVGKYTTEIMPMKSAILKRFVTIAWQNTIHVAIIAASIIAMKIWRKLTANVFAKIAIKR